MPELPEVEIYRQKFKDTALDKTIKAVKVLDNKILDGTTESELNSLLEGHKFTGAERIGKYLCLLLDSEVCLEVHFGMTGHLEYQENNQLPKSTRAIIEFWDGQKVAYVDPRKIGHISSRGSFQQLITEHNLGPDALSIDLNDFAFTIRSSKSKVKALLMDQTRISGIGNVYADEILFQAGIHPESVSGKLSENEILVIYNEISGVLRLAIEYIQGEESYQKARKALPEDFLIPHRKEGQECPRNCHGKVRMTKIGGRSTFFCDKCQKLIE